VATAEAGGRLVKQHFFCASCHTPGADGQKHIPDWPASSRSTPQRLLGFKRQTAADSTAIIRMSGAARRSRTSSCSPTILPTCPEADRRVVFRSPAALHFRVKPRPPPPRDAVSASKYAENSLSGDLSCVRFFPRPTGHQEDDRRCRVGGPPFAHAGAAGTMNALLLLIIGMLFAYILMDIAARWHAAMAASWSSFCGSGRGLLRVP